MRFNAKKRPICELLYRSGGSVQLSGVHRVLLGKRQGMKVWIVDRDTVVRSLYPEFIMGGNDQRYRFNPLDEVWIDSNIGVEELEYTIEHELIERKLMLERGWSYDRAHTEGGLAVEKDMRNANQIRVDRKMRSVKGLAAKDGTSTRAGRLIDPVCLSSMYRAYFGSRNGVAAWIVDGPKVRHYLNPDFCYSAHDLKAPFVPQNEIWIDSAMSVLEIHYTLRRARQERQMLADGVKFDIAYETAMQAELNERNRQARLVARHESCLAPVSYGVRQKGVKNKS